MVRTAHQVRYEKLRRAVYDAVEGDEGRAALLGAGRPSFAAWRNQRKLPSQSSGKPPSELVFASKNGDTAQLTAGKGVWFLRVTRSGQDTFLGPNSPGATRHPHFKGKGYAAFLQLSKYGRLQFYLQWDVAGEAKGFYLPLQRK